jgi:hypothetical protein
VDGLERELDRLFGLPLAEFITARNELAQQLKNTDDDASAEIRGLPKPSLPAWTINQLSRHERDAVRALLDAGAALRKAQESALRREGPAAALRDAAAKERNAIQLLTRRARTLLAGTGRPASPAMLDRIARTLQAAAVDEDGRRLLETGRLTHELEPAGFEALSSMQPSPGRPSPSGRDELADRRRQREDRERRKRELQQNARELERAAREAEREAERAADAAADARDRAASARAAADEAAETLAEL